MQKKYSNDEITDLIVGHLRRELSTEEEKILGCWLEESPEHRAEYRECVKNYLHLRWTEEERAVDVERAEDKIFNTFKRKRLKHWYYGVAASMVLLCTLAIGLLNYEADKPVEVLPVAQTFIPDNRQPRLILPDGEVIGLDSTQKVIKTKDGSMICVEGGGGISYDSFQTKPEQDVVWHRIEIPRGGEYYIHLEDGSEIWLNSESEISYPVPFAGNIREILLKGEAYFKVTKDATRAFVVNSGAYRLQVYGTEFNLNTYDDENIEAVLVKGSIGFQANAKSGEQRLTANQLGLANCRTGASEVRQVDVTPYIAWKNNDLVFMNENLESIMKKVSRWYDVEVIFEDEVSKKVLFNGNIRKYSELRQLLSVMEKVSEVKFQIINKTIRISKK